MPFFRKSKKKSKNPFLRFLRRKNVSLKKPVNNTISPRLQSLPNRTIPQTVLRPLSRFSENTKPVSTGILPRNNGRVLTFVGVEQPKTSQRNLMKLSGSPDTNFRFSQGRTRRSQFRNPQFSKVN